MNLSATQQSNSSRLGWRPVVALQIVLLAAIVAVHYKYVIDWMARIWKTDSDWSHGFLIPVFGLYYLYMQRERMPTHIREHSSASRWIGAFILFLSYRLYDFSTFHNPMDYLKAVSLLGSIFGIMLMTCGWPISRWGWFAVAFLLFAIPLPRSLYVQMTMPLRFLAANVSSAVLNLLPDMDAHARGAIVDYIYKAKTGSLDVEQACSGMRLMITMMSLGVAMAFVSERPVWQRLTMTLSVVPIAIFCNIVRVTTTGFLYVFGHEEKAKGTYHTMLGIGMLFIAFGLYGIISYILNNLMVVEADEPAAPPQGTAI